MDIMYDMKCINVRFFFFCSNQTDDTQDLLHIFKQLPKKGDFKLDNVLESIYFFS